ncbi:MAG: hypothetical protein ACK5HP_04750 [Bacilli bacterium]
MEKKLTKKNKGRELNNLGIFVQYILVVILVIMSIITMYIPFLKIVTEIILSLVLFSMAYNNYIFYKRKGFTIMYIIVALLIIVVNVIMYGR